MSQMTSDQFDQGSPYFARKYIMKKLPNNKVLQLMMNHAIMSSALFWKMGYNCKLTVLFDSPQITAGMHPFHWIVTEGT